MCKWPILYDIWARGRGRSKLTELSSHDDVLENVGLTGKPFTVKHKDRVTEMTRAFLDYMKSLRLQAPEAINPVPNDLLGAEPTPEPEPNPEPDRDSSWDIKLTAQGFPILPTSIMKKELSKAVCERLMNEYIKQHYCRLITSIWINPILMTRRSSVREEKQTGAIQSIEGRYISICQRVLSPGRVYNQRFQKHASRPNSKSS